MRMQNLVYRTRLIPVRPRVWEGEGTAGSQTTKPRARVRPTGTASPDLPASPTTATWGAALCLRG